jgi:hypothetical protein
MIKRLWLGLAALFLLASPAMAQGISQKVAVCNPLYTGRCVQPDASGNTPITGTVTVTGTSDVNLKQVNGITTSTGAGVTGTGSQRVGVAQDTTTIAGSAPGTAGTASANVVTVQGIGGGTALPASQSGTWTVQPGNTANTTAWKVDGSAVTQPVSGTLTAVTTITNPIGVKGIDGSTISSGTNGVPIGLLSTSGAVLTPGVTNTDTLALATATGQVGAAFAVNAWTRIYNGATGSRAYQWVHGQDTPGTGMQSVVPMAECDDTSTTVATENQVAALRQSCADRALFTRNIPGTGAAAAIVPVVSTTLESCHVLKASPGNLYTLAVTIQATTGIVQVFDATSAPGDGAVTPAWSQPIVSNGTLGGATWEWSIPVRGAVGLTACFSSATTPFTKTASATAMFSAGVQ